MMLKFVLFSYLIITILSCSNIIVTPGASEDGDTYISYAADSHTLYGALYHYPAGDHDPSSFIDIIDWDSQKKIGKIKQVAHTYNVVGNINEFQVTFTETTFGGRSELSHQDNSQIDYGSLMWITLQRAKTAREAILTVAALVEEYGYHSSGESFSIGDKNEAWIMEIIGKGNFEMGAVWVARKIPDGYVVAHANQARITTFPLNDTENCLYSKDVITFAQERGYYPKEGKPEDFSFSDVYDPVTFSGARHCEARVFSVFSQLTDMSDYLDYAQGYNLKNRMPLWVKPKNKLKVSDVMHLMRSHYEETWFDMAEDGDFGNEPFQVPHRWPPLTWKDTKGNSYTHERPISTQQTGFSMVSMMRSYLPDPIGGILWFGVDETQTTVYAPMYCSMTDIPKPYKKEVAKIMQFSMDSQFWVFSLVANWVYTKFSYMQPELQIKQNYLESQYIKQVKEIDTKASELYKHDVEKAIQLLTNFSCQTGEDLHKEWKDFFGYLFTRYVDGDLKTVVEGEPLPKVQFVGYNERWYDEIVETTGDHYKIPEGENSETLSKLGRMKGV